MRRWHLAAGFLALGSAAAVSAAADGDPGLAAVLGPIRDRYGLPALGGAIVDGNGLRAKAVVGVRKLAETTEATADDLWHLGSDTKAMTATMIAALVEQGKLSWDSTLGAVFPDMQLPAPVGGITLLQLLSHREGLPHDADWSEISRKGSLVQQRRAAVARLASVALLSIPGTKFSYSNWGYVVAGAMAEQVAGKSYEELMKAIVFDPLHMESVGYGPAGSRGGTDEPWGHTKDGAPSWGDNPLVVAPAGCVHCSLDDWGKFISDQLRGAEGKPALLKPASYLRLHSAPFGGTYALGWGVADRPWGGGQVFSHAGSNTMNFALVRMAPARDFAVLVVCNQGGSEKACDDAATALISLHGAGHAAPGVSGGL
jgi:CubicO group peptidase (beta-lactamase class C family)